MEGMLLAYGFSFNGFYSSSFCFFFLLITDFFKGRI